MGKSKKCDFCFCKKLFDGARSPFFGKVASMRQQGSRKSQGFARDFWEEEYGKRACELCPLGQSENAADRSDEKAWFSDAQKIIERKIPWCHPERSGGIAAAK